eukprot:1161214-Pelagomonas_calceolata.AAC.17
MGLKWKVKETSYQHLIALLVTGLGINWSTCSNTSAYPQHTHPAALYQLFSCDTLFPCCLHYAAQTVHSRVLARLCGQWQSLLFAGAVPALSTLLAAAVNIVHSQTFLQLGKLKLHEKHMCVGSGSAFFHWIHTCAPTLSAAAGQADARMRNTCVCGQEEWLVF